MGEQGRALEAMELDPAFWRGRRVFVTGHTGFKGSWLLLLLRALGAEATGFALDPPTDPSMFALLALGDLCTDRRGDVRDGTDLTVALVAADPEIVIHMAAQPLVRASYQRPVETYGINVMGTVHLLEACRAAPGVRAVVGVTTDKCYENAGWTWGYRENDRLGGADPYSNSKACSELVIDAYRQSFFGDHIGVASARAGNVIGGGDFARDRLVPDAVRAFRSSAPLLIRNPLAVRPWQHVLEPLYGYLLLAERLHGDARFAAAWNFGPRPEESAAVGDVASRLAGLWGGDARWAQDSSDHRYEAATLKLDSTKSRIELGWSPRFALDEALRWTADWYRAFDRGEDLDALTKWQVSEFLDVPAT